MRKLLLSTLIIFSFFVLSAQAQSSQISDLAAQLQQNINSLSERSAKEFIGRTDNDKNELENLLLAEQLKATFRVFRLLADNKRPNSELRDVADSLRDLADKSSSKNNPQWQQVKKETEELARLLKDSDSKQDDKPDKNKGVIGKLHWQGTIDDEVQLVINGGAVQIKTITGKEFNDGIFNFSSPLPDENVQIFVNKKDGRGAVKVIQMPTRDNNFTAIIQILDKSGGAKEYDLEIYWTR